MKKAKEFLIKAGDPPVCPTCNRRLHFDFIVNVPYGRRLNDAYVNSFYCVHCKAD